MGTVGIYKIENDVTHKVYIGQSIHLTTRYNEHLCALRRGVHYLKVLQDEFNEYGENHFSFNVLEECSVTDLDDRETYWLDAYGGYQSDTVYNKVNGGRHHKGDSNPMYGHVWSEQRCSEQSARMKAYFSDPTNHPMYGKHHTEESRKKISESQKGVPQPEELNRKRSETMKRKFASGELKSHSKGRGSGFVGAAAGKKWITNGSCDKYWDPSSELPEGFRYGRTFSRKLKTT